MRRGRSARPRCPAAGCRESQAALPRSPGQDPAPLMRLLRCPCCRSSHLWQRGVPGVSGDRQNPPVRSTAASRSSATHRDAQSQCYCAHNFTNALRSRLVQPTHQERSHSQHARHHQPPRGMVEQVASVSKVLFVVNVCMCAFLGGGSFVPLQAFERFLETAAPDCSTRPSTRAPRQYPGCGTPTSLLILNRMCPGSRIETSAFKTITSRHLPHDAGNCRTGWCKHLTGGRYTSGAAIPAALFAAAAALTSATAVFAAAAACATRLSRWSQVWHDHPCWRLRQKRD